MMKDAENKRQRPSIFSGFVCDYCDKPLSRRDKLVNHIKNRHPGRPIPLSPSKEKSILKSVTPNKISPASSASKPKKVVECMFCNKTLSRADKLDYHVRNVHFKNGKLDDSVLDKYILELKNKNKTPVPSSPTTPPVKKTSSVGQSPVRDRYNPTPCPYCQKIFSRKDSIYPHISSQHPGKKLPTSISSSPLKSGKHTDNGEKKKAAKVDRPSPKKAEKENETVVEQKRTVAADWKKVWSSGNPVYVKFNFKRPKRRKRTLSEITVDLETIEYPASGSKKVKLNNSSDKKINTSKPVLNGERDKGLGNVGKLFVQTTAGSLKAVGQPTQNRETGSISKLSFNSPVVRLKNTYLPSSSPTHTPSSTPTNQSSSTATHQMSSPTTHRPQPNLIEKHRRSVEETFVRIPVSPPKKKIQILQSITYK